MLNLKLTCFTKNKQPFSHRNRSTTPHSNVFATFTHFTLVVYLTSVLKKDVHHKTLKGDTKIIFSAGGETT